LSTTHWRGEGRKLRLLPTIVGGARERRRRSPGESPSLPRRFSVHEGKKKRDLPDLSRKEKGGEQPERFISSHEAKIFGFEPVHREVHFLKGKGEGFAVGRRTLKSWDSRVCRTADRSHYPEKKRGGGEGKRRNLHQEKTKERAPWKEKHPLSKKKSGHFRRLYLHFRQQRGVQGTALHSLLSLPTPPS